jgi:hypothetical protein
VEANGGSKVAERVEGSSSVPGWALKVAVISMGEHSCLEVALLGLLRGYLKRKVEQPHATRVALAFPALR